MISSCHLERITFVTLVLFPLNSRSSLEEPDSKMTTVALDPPALLAVVLENKEAIEASWTEIDPLVC